MPSMLNLAFSENLSTIARRFERFFVARDMVAQARATEPLGYDPALLSALGAMGAMGMRAGVGANGVTGGLMAAAVIAEAAGRHLAPAPLIEVMIAARLLGELGGEHARDWLDGAVKGDRVVTLALHEAQDDRDQVAPAGAVADAVLALQDETVFLVARKPTGVPCRNLAGAPIGRITLVGTGAQGERIDLASGPAARAAYLAAIEEWKLLTAAALNGLARRALELAADHAKTRVQFGRPIGSFQGVAHPLADCAADVDAAQLLTWQCIQDIALSRPSAAASIDMSFWWSADVADRTTRRALHTFGGYGVTVDSDIQLYFRRAKGMALVLGDPADRLAEAGRRMWAGATAPLPPAGDDWLDFRFGDEAEALADETRTLLAAATTPEWRANVGWSMDSFDAEIHRRLGEAGLMHPSWPVEWGGRNAHPYAAALALSTWEEFDVPANAQAVSHFVGATLERFASDDLKHEVLKDIGLGLKTCSLGYSEPESGSDIFAATTRAVWDEAAQMWVINGQKMFTSAANRTDYIFLLARTDTDSGKHGGITMFLAPTSAAGVAVKVVDTMQEERTAATFYTDVRLPDRYRVGDINGGQQVLAAALVLEQGGSFKTGCHKLVDAAVAWMRRKSETEPDWRDRPDVLARLAKTKVFAMLTDLLAKRALFWGVTEPDRRTAFGSMNKLFRSESCQRAAADLIDLAAPDSLFRGADDAGRIERGHRLGQIYTIYGGTSEIHRSVVAELALGLPRSR